jgi:hypothetical protein
MKSLTSRENLSINPLQGAFLAFPKLLVTLKRLFKKPPVNLKIVPKAGHEFAVH